VGQYAILIVLSALILTGIVLFNAQQKAQGADDDLTEYHEDRFGREIALVGLKRTERLLAQNADLWDLHTSNNTAAQDTFASPTATTFTKGALTGTYQVTYDSYTAKTGTTPELATITALGTYNGKTYTVRATYEQGETDIGVPPSMRSAIVTDQTLTIQGSPNLWGSTHSNGQTNTVGNGFDVQGSGTYTNGSAPGNPGNFTGGVAYQDSISVPIVSIPPVSGYTHRIDGNQNWGNMTQNFPAAWFGGDAGYGTQANPYVLYINGNLTISNNKTVELLGHVRIYVNGTFKMRANAELKPTTASTLNWNNASDAQISNWVNSNMPNGSTIAVYANDIAFQGTPFIAAHLYSKGPVNYGGGGNQLIMGGVTSLGNMSLSGNPKIYYVDTNTSILDPGSIYQTPNGIRLAAYREWATR